MEETACTSGGGEGSGGGGSSPLPSTPQGSGAPLQFLSKMKGGGGGRAASPQAQAHTQPQRLHRRLDNTTLKDKQPLPSPTTASSASRSPRSAALQPPGRRGGGGGGGRAAVRDKGQRRGEGENQGQPFTPRLLAGRAPPTPLEQGDLARSLAAASPAARRRHLLEILRVAELLDGDREEVAGDIRDHHVRARGHLGTPVASLLLRLGRRKGQGGRLPPAAASRGRTLAGGS